MPFIASTNMFPNSAIQIIWLTLISIGPRYSKVKRSPLPLRITYVSGLTWILSAVQRYIVINLKYYQYYENSAVERNIIMDIALKYYQ